MTAIKIHPPIIEAITQCLKPILEEGKVADKEVGAFLKQHKQFGARDRSMIAESVYDIIRWKLKYVYQLEQTFPQFTYYKQLLAVSLLNRNYEIKNPEAFGITLEEIKVLEKAIELLISEKYIEQSYPENFYDFCLQQIGEEWHEWAKALNQTPNIFIRANTLKTTTAKLLSVLENEQINTAFAETINIPAIAKPIEVIQIFSKNNLKNSMFYKSGLFEFQDIGSQAIGSFIINNIQQKMQIQNLSVLDLCAGAGGKSLHLSALMQNKGKIIATDYQASRLKNLSIRANQAGCQNIEVVDFNAAKNIKDLDVILIDAPCSGSGTFRRQADLKYKITAEKIQEYTKIQANLLQESSKQLSKNGKIIYATCSILPQENQLQIKHFLSKNQHFILENEVQLLPTNYSGDGFYMACLALKK
jgi:16S rRNA (cytosine967-C5)-methyltransferase